MTSVQENINKMLHRSLRLHGVTLDKDGKFVDAEEANKAFLRELAGITPNPAEQAKILIEAWGDEGKMRDLNAVRIEQVGNYIASESNFLSAFFESVTLKDDEEAFVVNDTKNEIRVGNLGEDGVPDTMRVLKPESKIPIALAFISSEKVKYKTLDIYKGRIAEATQKTFDIAFDLRFKLDRIGYNLLTASLANGGCFGAFSYEQTRAAKEKRIYLAHSGIVTSHLPTTNDFDMTQTANHATNPNEDGELDHFQVKVLKAVIKYADSWANVFPTGRLVPDGNIIVPSSDIFAIADDATPTGSVQDRIREDINKNGYTTLHYLGRDWHFIPDVTIPSGTCYPRFNQVPGKVFYKPSLDKEFVKTNEEENWEERYQRKVVGAHIISQHRVRALRIKYA